MSAWSKAKKAKAAIGGSVVVAVGVIVVPLLYDLYDAGVIKVGDPASDWNGMGTLVCGGNQSMTVRDKTFDEAPEGVKGALILAGGNCKLKIVKSTITSRIVLSVGGNAQATVVDSKLMGTKVGLKLGGNAKVWLVRSTIEGKTAIRAGGSAKVEHDAKSEIKGRIRGRKRRVKQVDQIPLEDDE